ncbi:hypothetical protein BM536_038960 [Streptomyces phaeoluteigriseus]|uniref:Uncharacterized protein n=2 Tax=Streptomyces phaeoluteigriseus TaxID=114686 RepID=A0A1V6MGQ4_9ACTN|nr:hypothetical protein BM536_038960 [Streptomyces phaeoluteigriseus]
MMPCMRDDTVRDQIRYLRECIKADEALALVAGEGWPEPTDEVASALRSDGFTDEQIRLYFNWGPHRAGAYVDLLQRIVDQLEMLSSVRRPAHKDAVRRGIHSLLHLYRNAPGWDPTWGPDFPYARLSRVTKERAVQVLADADRRTAGGTAG